MAAARAVVAAGMTTVTLDRCPVCGANEAEPFLEMPDLLHGVPGRFRYERCGACRSVYQNPRVREDRLHELYPEAYYTHSAAEPAAAAAEGGLLRRARDRIREGVTRAVRSGGGPVPWWGRLLARSRRVRERAFRDLPDAAIPRVERPGRALEIGPGSGEALELLHRAGWDVEGVEWDPEAARVAEERSGRPVRAGSFLDAGLDEGSYDLVYMAHVLEHLADPKAALEAVGRLLRPGAGRAVLLFPNPGSLGARLFGPDWYPWEAPRHLVLPSVSGVRELARVCGLEASVRTGTGRAVWIAWSRRRRRDEAPDGARIRWTDRLFQLVEAGLVALGLPWGEETIAVLRRPGR